MFLLSDLLEISGLGKSKVRLIRHTDREINLLDTFQNDLPLFEAYQSFLQKNKLTDTEYVIVFAAYHGTQALFLGIWEMCKEMPVSEAPPEMLQKIEGFIEKLDWDIEKSSYYKLQKTEILSSLSERLIIDWGLSTISWIQKKSDKPVVSILPPSHIHEFESYDKTVLNWDQLQKLIQNPNNNATWFNALKAVNGIYCIVDMSTGKLYIGSAYGKDGIWQRWSCYVTTNGHGGNKKLEELLTSNSDAMKHFQFIILEILPGSCTQKDAVDKENLWKLKLASRQHGYNDN